MREAAGHLGVSVGYRQATMLNFKNNIYLNSSAKRSLLSAYSDEEIRAMAGYLADL